MTIPVPDPAPDPVLALSAARLLSNSSTTAKAVSRWIHQGTGTGSTDPLLSNSEAGTEAVTELDTAVTVKYPIHPAAATLLEVAPDPSPAGERPALGETESNPTEAGTTRGTAAALAERPVLAEMVNFCQITGYQLVPSTTTAFIIFFPSQY